MIEVPSIRPISDFRTQMNDVLTQMDEEPVVLASRSTPRAVLVSVEEWEKIRQQMVELRLSVKTLNDALKEERKNQPHHSLDEIIEMGKQKKVAA